MAKSIMIQGTGSNVGKSMLVAGLARALTRRGLRVAPFKPQNMSNNAAVTADGGEIGRAQALQALAAGLAPHTDMNPVLLKPESQTGSQVVVQGKMLRSVKARDYGALKPRLMNAVLESFDRLSSTTDIVLVEGAGSPAEINLRAGDIANLGFAQAAQVPVVLVGDIDRGGVIAQIAGTKTVLPAADASLIKGFIINKFRGDPDLFSEGYTAIEGFTGWPGFGVLPWFGDAHLLPAEDSADIRSSGTGHFKIAVLQLSRIANFDDFDPLKSEPDVELTMLKPGQVLPADTDLVIIPGSKSTRDDLAFLRQQGWDTDIAAHVRRGGRVLGICGGYQMLGRMVHDPQGIEGPAGASQGLGLLDVETVMVPKKRLADVSGTGFGDTPLRGYEIHIGETSGPDCARPWLTIEGRPEGAQSPNGLIAGCYIHGVFTADGFRAKFLQSLGIEATTRSYDLAIQNTLDALADHLEAHLDIDGLLAVAANGL